MAKIFVQNTQITVIKQNEDDYISLTDMLKAKDGEFFFSNWLHRPASSMRKKLTCSMLPCSDRRPSNGAKPILN